MFLGWTGWRGVCNAKGNTGLGGFYTFKLLSRIVVRLKVKQSNPACDNKGNRMRFIMKKHGNNVLRFCFCLTCWV